MKKASIALLGLLTTTPMLAASLQAAEGWEALEYRNIGPARGGRVTTVAGTVQETGTFYLGASGGGVWKTTDYGTSWHNVSDGFFATPSIGDIAVSQNDANIVYVGTGSDGLRSNIINGKGVYKSINGGESWEQIGLTRAGLIGAVEIDPRSDNTVWVAAIGQPFADNPERGVYKTTDGGQRWEKVLFKSDSVGFSDIELLPGNPDVVFATAWKAQRKPWTIVSGGDNDEGGLYKSVDGGNSWRKITAGLPEGLIGKMDLAISAADSSVVYVLVEAPDDQGGLYKSTDQGETFTQVSDEGGIRSRPFYYTNIEADPQNPDVVYSLATRYYRTDDGGEHWTRMRAPHGDSHDMWINPENPQLFIQANDGGANVTHNGGKTWSTQFNQPTTELYQVEVDDQYPYWLYGGQQDNGSTIAVPSRAPWRVQHQNAWLIETGGCETGPAVPKPGDHNTVYANCKGRFGVFDKRTGTERGYYIGAANMYGHNPADLRYRFQRVSPIHVSPHDPDTVYMGSQYVHRTRDDGVTWEAISPDLTAFEADKQVISGAPITRDITGEEFYSTIYSLRESPIEPGVIWTGANDGPVHVTRDGGSNWDEVTPRMPKGGRVDSISASHHNAGTAYVSVLRYQLDDWKPYIYKLENYGKRATLLTDGKNGIPADHPVRVVREDPERAGLLYAGTEYGLFVSFDDGDNWQSFQQNMPVTPITDLKVHRGDLAISTMGRGFWVLDNVATLRQMNAADSAETLTLLSPQDAVRYRQTFRNADADAVPQYPAPSAIIDYVIPDSMAGKVKLEILTADGELVNAYESQAGESEPDTIVEDMALSRAFFIENKALSNASGLNRFHWDMRWRGAWKTPAKNADTDAAPSYDTGPLAAPGEYTVRLTAAGETQQTTLTLTMDPRVVASGVDASMVNEQVAFLREVTALLTAARELAHGVKTQRADYSDTDPRAAQLDSIASQLETAKGIYMQPKLIDQIRYLYYMVNNADQLPGKEATDRLQTLTDQLETISALANEE